MAEESTPRPGDDPGGSEETHAQQDVPAPYAEHCQRFEGIRLKYGDPYLVLAGYTWLLPRDG